MLPCRSTLPAPHKAESRQICFDPSKTSSAFHYALVSLSISSSIDLHQKLLLMHQVLMSEHPAGTKAVLRERALKRFGLTKPAPVPAQLLLMLSMSRYSGPQRQRKRDALQAQLTHEREYLVSAATLSLTLARSVAARHVAAALLQWEQECALQTALGVVKCKAALQLCLCGRAALPDSLGRHAEGLAPKMQR